MKRRAEMQEGTQRGKQGNGSAGMEGGKKAARDAGRRSFASTHYRSRISMERQGRWMDSHDAAHPHRLLLHNALPYPLTWPRKAWQAQSTRRRRGPDAGAEQADSKQSIPSIHRMSHTSTPSRVWNPAHASHRQHRSSLTRGGYALPALCLHMALSTAPLP